MADYYPLLAKAVSGLKTSTPGARAAIYERARKALLGQLRSMQPPAPESAIDREAAALDEAIARLELEFAAASDEPAPVPPETAHEAAPVAHEPAPAAPEAPPAAHEPAREPPPILSAEESKPETGDATDENGWRAGAPARETQRPAAPKPDLKQRGGMRRLGLILGAVTFVVAMVGFAAWKLRDRPEDLAKLNPGPETADQKSGGKIGERVGADAGGGRPAPAGGTNGGSAIPVAYRAAVLVQAPSEPGGVKTYVGSVVWRRESTNRGPNQQLSPAVRAEIDVPDARMKASVLMEKNYESALSVSHTLTVRFDPGPDSPIGNVNAVNMPEMRRDDAPKGAPLQGLPVDIAPNVFLIGLSSAFEQQNIEMIRGLNWFDLPMSLASGKIAKLTFEKGAAGDKILSEALTDWKTQ